jgi:long-subunit acyl-CoA synthetase (AMP-forming)
VAIMAEPGQLRNGLLTPTMKLKRLKVVESNQKEFDALYAGH